MMIAVADINFQFEGSVLLADQSLIFTTTNVSS